MEVIRLTDSTLHWFLPILPEEYKKQVTRSTEIFALGAVKNGTACGVLVFRMGAMEAAICYLAVSDLYRRQGAAAAMIEYLIACVSPSGIVVNCTFSIKDRNSPLYLLFAEHPLFEVYKETGGIYSFTGEEIKMCRKLDLKLENFRLQLFYDLPSNRQKELFANLTDRGIGYEPHIFKGADAVCRELCVCTEHGGEVKSAVFMEKDGSDYHLCYAYSIKGYTKDLFCLLAYLRKELLNRYIGGDNITLSVAAVNEETERIVSNIFPGHMQQYSFYTAYSDLERVNREVSK